VADLRAGVLAAVLAGAALGGGCGGDGERVVTSGHVSQPPAGTTSAATEASTTEVGGLTEATTTATQTTPVTTTTPSTTTTTAAPGAGDERPARVPAVFTIASAGISPGRITVPAFLTIELTGVSEDGVTHTLALSAGRAYSVAIPAGGRASKVVPGLKPGTYVVVLDGRVSAASLEVGGEPGP